MIPSSPITPLKIISGAMFFSLINFLGIIFFMGSKNDWPFSFSVTSENRILLIIFSMIAFSNLSLAYYFPRLNQKKDKTLNTNENLNNKLFFDFSKNDAKMQSITIVRMALAESVAILGCITSLLFHSTAWIVPFFCVALFFQVLFSPWGKFLLDEKKS